MPSPTFDIAACAAALGDDAYAFSLHALAECDSTNTQLMRYAEEGAPSGTLFVADHQSGGRGRRGRAWISSPQHSLTFSLLWRFGTQSSAPEALSLAVGLGLQRGLAALKVPAMLKWPNDILCHGRKLAGVLIEVQPGDIKSAIIGVGINLCLPPALPADIAGSAIAFDAVMPQLPTREQILAALLTHLAAILRHYEVAGFTALRDEWQARHAFQQREVHISGGEDVSGTCCGVSERGELIVNTAAGVHTVISGDVSLRLT